MSDVFGAQLVSSAADVALAVAQARDLAGVRGAVLVTGSIMLVAQACELLGMTLRRIEQAGHAVSVAA